MALHIKNLSILILAFLLVSGMAMSISYAVSEVRPDYIIALESSTGTTLIDESRFKTDFELLSGSFEPQINGYFCGLASSSIVLNTMLNSSTNDHYQQSTLLSQKTDSIVTKSTVRTLGITLMQLTAIFDTHDIVASSVRSSKVGPDVLKSKIVSNLSEPGNFVIVNCSRRFLGQPRSGPISPVAAYHAESDRILVMDDATPKLPMAWINGDDLIQASATIDPVLGLSRGFVFVSRSQ